MILVLGATGTVGSGVARALSAAGARQRLLVRDPARLPAPWPVEAEVVTGDFTDQAAFAGALADVSRLFLLTKPSPQQPALEAALVAAARAAGVRCVVRLSVMGADAAAPSPVRRWHGECDALVLDAGCDAVLLRPNFFMQNLLMFAAGIARRGSFALPAGEARVSMIDAADIAAVAAAVLSRPPAGRTVLTLTGPEALDFAAVAAVLGEAAGRPVAYQPMARAEFAARLVKGGQPAWYADAMAALYDDFAAGLNAPVSGDVERVLGRPATSLAAFAARHRAKFGAGPA